MNTKTIPTSRVADLMYKTRATVHQWFANPEIQPILPPLAANGSSRNFNERQAMLMMVVGDLVRSGLKLPLAARWAARIAEQLLFAPEAAKINVEFRRNGAIFCFTTDEAPEAAAAAGPARYRLTFNLDAYRTAIREKMTDSAAAAGDRDD